MNAGIDRTCIAFEAAMTQVAEFACMACQARQASQRVRQTEISNQQLTASPLPDKDSAASI